MSFFGFDTSLPPRQSGRSHNTAAPGFTQPQDAFASFSGRGQEDLGDALDFEETYDGLGDQLEETGDAFNDDTFGDDAPATQTTVGKDFDFFGQTDRVAEAMREEQMRYNAGRTAKPATTAQQKASKPARTGYEGYIPQLEANASIWGLPQQKQTSDPEPHRRQQSGTQSAARRMVTLEEIEASMRNQSHPTQQEGDRSHYPAMQTQPSVQQQMQFLQGMPHQPFPGMPFPGMGLPPHLSPAQMYGQPVQMPQNHQQQHQQQQQMQQPHGSPIRHPMELLQNQLPPGYSQRQQLPQQLAQQVKPGPSPGPGPDGQHDGSTRQMMQNPNRLAGQGQPLAPLPGQLQDPSHRRGPSYQGPIITSPQQILQLSAEDRAAFLEEEARRAKRNHKIAMMAKFNGLMTPQDKNYVSRIQLTHLMSASGNLDDQSPEAKLNEDFYYQVHSQIRGGSRQNPNQPASQFAQTYLFQTGNRYGGGRRYHRGGDNHMQRMQQQVQRAVEVAKTKPKASKLNFEGSLGTIAFSNSKAPRPMLNIKSADEGLRPPTAGRRPSRIHDAAAERREALRNIENVFRSLMAMEDHERQRPPRLQEGADASIIQAHMDWRERLHALNQQLWNDLKVMEPVVPNSPTTHPFIAILSFAKGKKLIPRVWRHIDEQQRLTILTLIAIHLDSLDVVAHALPSLDQTDQQLPTAVRDEIDLFCTTVMPTLFMYLNEAQLPIIVGLLGLLLDRSQITNIVRTKVGVSVLTMLISRVELLKSSAGPQQLSPVDLDQWAAQYNRLFDLAEPALPFLFGNSSIHESDDVHIWQFLAAMGAAASPEQQQRLVIGVKERVMETVSVSKALPKELASVRLGHVNLFMRAIGLDVELLG